MFLRIHSTLQTNEHTYCGRRHGCGRDRLLQGNLTWMCQQKHSCLLWCSAWDELCGPRTPGCSSGPTSPEQTLKHCHIGNTTPTSFQICHLDLCATCAIIIILFLTIKSLFFIIAASAVKSFHVSYSFLVLSLRRRSSLFSHLNLQCGGKNRIKPTQLFSTMEYFSAMKQWKKLHE